MEILGDIPGRARIKINEIYRNIQFANDLEKAVSSLEGVLSISANALTSNALVYFQPERIQLKQIIQFIREGIQSGFRTFTYLMRKDVHWHSFEISKVEQLTSTSVVHGLDPEKVRIHRLKYGSNRLSRMKIRSEFSIFLHQFQNLPTLLLLGSTALSVVAGSVLDGVVILAVIVINAAIGFKMESSAEKTIQSLIRPIEADIRVIRGNKTEEIHPDEIVVGDLLLLNPGTMIPADARLVQVERLNVDESILTGESFPVYKDSNILKQLNLPLGDRLNMVYKGTSVTGGSGAAIVVEVGDRTEIGKIQRLMSQSEQPQTPVEKQLSHLGNQMVIFALTASSALLLVGVLRGMRFINILKTSISMAVAAIPESLPTVSTTTHARSIKLLKDQNVWVRSLDAVETLANVNMICLDKTGTLTMNQMEVTQVVTPKQVYVIRPSGCWIGEMKVDCFHERAIHELLKVAVLCNEAEVVPQIGSGAGGLVTGQGNGHVNTKKLNGSSTEEALLKAAHNLGMNIDLTRKKYLTISTQYRSESHQFMKTVHRYSDPTGVEKRFVAIKGAPDEVLSLCKVYSTDGMVQILRDTDRKKILSQNEKMADQGLRVLGFAYGDNTNAGNLIWLGLVGMTDPIRAGIMDLIPKFHRAGINTSMITGDQKRTAQAIGVKLGVQTVFARVSPSKKLKLIQQLQHSGKVVAMIGDGVNDGPALKSANIGIAMAAKGAEAASLAADIVLPNDDITSMLSAIKEGRTVHRDIKKAVDYITAQNLCEILFTFVSVAVGGHQPFSPLQFLWINLVTDIFPELALAQDPADVDIMQQVPLDIHTPLLGITDLKKRIFESILLTSAPLVAYAIGFKKYGNDSRNSHFREEKARSLAFMTLTASSLFYTLTARSDTITFFDREALPKNHYIPLSIMLGFVAGFAGAFAPKLRDLLGNNNVMLREFILSTLGSLFPLTAIETFKFIQTRMSLKPA